MLVAISPAKRLDIKDNQNQVAGGTTPGFQAAAEDLVGYACKLGPEKLQKLMHISDNLARLNASRFAEFSSGEGLQHATQMFSGDTYLGLEAMTLEVDEMDWAQDHLRILSGLYGLLRPRDLIQPHRLEMGSRLKTAAGKNLYEYWGDRLALALNAAADAVGSDTLINCASVEYFGAVDRDALKLRVITPVFMEEKAGTPKIVSFFAKKARGAMARFMIERRITDAEGLKDFDSGGYRFNPGMSDGDRWVFLRDYPDQPSGV